MRALGVLGIILLVQANQQSAALDRRELRVGVLRRARERARDPVAVQPLRVAVDSAVEHYHDLPAALGRGVAPQQHD